MGGDGPPRGGTRGGRDQFDWEAVKSDKDREFYLGASVKASVGRWQKGRDILWYTRDKEGGPGGLADELAAVKAEEERVRTPCRGCTAPARVHFLRHLSGVARLRCRGLETTLSSCLFRLFLRS